MEKKIGHYSFIIGVILALILGLASNSLGDAVGWLYSLLVVLGLIVGFINVTGKETTEFLTVATILVIVSFAGDNTISKWQNVKFIGLYLQGIFASVMAFVVPAAVVVGLKDVYALGQMSK